jgi:exo-beta-1,3-glucanase (GH17 family)
MMFTIIPRPAQCSPQTGSRALHRSTFVPLRSEQLVIGDETYKACSGKEIIGSRGARNVFDSVRIALMLAGIVLIAGLSLIPGAAGAPGVTLLSVPANGSTQDWISGIAEGVSPADHAVVVYVQVGSLWWGPKPTFPDPMTAIRPDGFWDADVVTGGTDAQATRYAAYLVPRSIALVGEMPPELHGAANLPGSLSAYPHDLRTRSSITPLPGPAIAREGTDLVGLDFGPYVAGERPGATVLTEEVLRLRLEAVAGNTTWIRTFGVDSGLERVGPLAHSLGKKTAIGAWLGPDLTANQAQLKTLVRVAREGGADLLIVGSETLQRSDLSDRALVTYMQWVRSQVPGVPVTTADTYTTILASPSVIEASDLLLVNIYPYWEGAPIETAVSRTRVAYLAVVAAAKGRPVAISEMGWPDAGETRGEAVPNMTNAIRYLHDATAWAHAEGVPYFYFEAFDEAWKATDGEGVVGAHWGIWSGSLEPKPGRFPLPGLPSLVPGGAAIPGDTDGDGLCEDVNGNGRRDFADVVLCFTQMSWIAANEPTAMFDYNGNGRIDFADVVRLFTNL